MRTTALKHETTMKISIKHKNPVLKQHYMTPAECDVPTHHLATKGRSSQSYHRPIPLIQGPVSRPNTETGNSELDGFRLLEESGMAFPEDLNQVALINRGLSTVVEDDLVFFTELLYVDVSENRLDLGPFGSLPKLLELRFACNELKRVENICGFDNLLALDLAYNKLSLNAVQNLDSLPRLKELDLSGNNLRGLPLHMYTFASLEKLLLEYNKIEDNSVFEILSKMPNLRHVGLANNFLSSIPEEACSSINGGTGLDNKAGPDERLRYLEYLDVSFNYFGTEEDLAPVVELPRLLTLMIFGNPVLGPSGEDPMLIYVEALVERACLNRDGTPMKDIDFVTEIPKKRNLKKGVAVGRAGTYRDFAVVQVETQISNKSSREWREYGKRTAFAEAVLNGSLSRASSSTASNVLPGGSATSLPVVAAAAATGGGGYSLGYIPADHTFLTGSLGQADMVHNGGEKGGGGGGGIVSGIAATAATGRVQQQQQGSLTLPKIHGAVETSSYNAQAAAIDAIADDVMRQVTREMHLVGSSSEISYMQKTASLPPTAISGRDNNNNYDGENNNNSKRVDGRLPQRLFNPTLEDPSAMPSQPIALKTAMKALTLMLKNPLTDYNEIPTKNSLYQQDHQKSTKASTERQMPRQPPKITQLDPTDDSLDKKEHKYKNRGLHEPAIVQERRQENRAHTLTQIEKVLDSLNNTTGDFLERTDVFTSSATQKETNAHLRRFAQPLPDGGAVHKDVKGLTAMVQQVIGEFAK